MQKREKNVRFYTHIRLNEYTFAEKMMRALLLISFIMFFSSIRSEEKVITISNSTEVQRSEVVEIDNKGLEASNKSFVVKNALGQEVPWQLTHDGKLLLYVTVQPQSKAVFKLEQGTPKPQKSWVGGRQYRERKDDLSFENDRMGFRIYGPALQRGGERAYGIDLWLKRTPELVLDTIYRRRHYHIDNGLGLDCYNVGPTLGCGAPARMVGHSIAYSWCYTNYEILDNGPLRFTVALDFEGGERRIVSLDRGSHFCRTTVTWPQPVDICTGIVLHAPLSIWKEVGGEALLYVDPTRDPKKYNFQIYTGVLCPDGFDETRELLFPQPQKDALGHLLGIKRNVNGLTYYNGAAWSDYDIPTWEAWQLYVRQYLEALQHPLEIQIQ